VFRLQHQSVMVDTFQNRSLSIHPPVDCPAQNAPLTAKLVE